METENNITLDFRDYYELVDATILDSLNAMFRHTMKEELTKEDYHHFFEVDVTKIEFDDDPEEKLFWTEAAQFIQLGFNIGVMPSDLGVDLTTVLLNHGWIP